MRERRVRRRSLLRSTRWLTRPRRRPNFRAAVPLRSTRKRPMRCSAAAWRSSTASSTGTPTRHGRSSGARHPTKSATSTRASSRWRPACCTCSVTTCRGARNKLSEGLARLQAYLPAHHGIFVNELVGKGERILDDLEGGFLPYLIPPVIRFADLEEQRLEPMSAPDPEQGYRIEHDSMGDVRVPTDAKWRAQTQRAVENFPIIRRNARALAHRGAGAHQGRGRPRQRRARHRGGRDGRGHRLRGRGGGARRLGRPLPDRRLPDRLRHLAAT